MANMEVVCMADIDKQFSGEDNEIIVKLQISGLINKTVRCKLRTCRRVCQLKYENNVKLKHVFKCPKRHMFKSVVSGSYFEKSHLSVLNIMRCIWMWSCRTPCLVASELINLNRKSIGQQYRFLRDICSWKLLNNPELQRLGGAGHVIQIDESVITKRKYNVGRVIPQKWILGIYDTTIKKGVIIYVKTRDTKTLTKLILEHVMPGSEVWTDCWKGYNCLKLLEGVSPFIHKTVNHSKNFKDPVTGVCTNQVEGYWSRLKKYCRTQRVLGSNLLPEHIDHFMWLEHFGGQAKSTYNNIINHIRERYPV